MRKIAITYLVFFSIYWAGIWAFIMTMPEWATFLYGSAIIIVVAAFLPVSRHINNGLSAIPLMIVAALMSSVMLVSTIEYIPKSSENSVVTVLTASVAIIIYSYLISYISGKLTGLNLLDS